ncbi:ATP-binding protein [Bosea sp. (in: a-proteobacteria)]|uniref:ATP-binding protein n=1 Tax=Bosea sp. (in: a-proteobacteria) TaxID=1871050 RepID=UPI001216B039|nr:ATP-binding protein [Bosea sp. (in: a-proteobacteria)]TAJ30704.1 MAG: response regulator [Bosea sp. (in: a-proteobacteria)]
MVLPLWLISTIVLVGLAGAVLCGAATLRWRGRMLAQQAALGHEVESLTDRLWATADREQRYRSLVEAQGDFIVRRDGATIVYANAAYAALFGAQEGDLVGSDGQLPQLALRPRAQQEDGTRSFDECLATHEGERWVAWAETVVAGPDGRIVVQRVGRDISARIADEDALVEARSRAEAASEAKSRFLATVSHEFRTPLNGILGMSDLLQDTGLDAEQSTYVQALRTSGEALLALVDDILDFAKVEAGRIELMREPFDAVQLVETVAELMAPRAQAKGIELAAHIAPDVPARLVGDRDRLRQILLNLVGNAVKFTTSGGVGVSLCRAGSAIEIVVADTGPGIPVDRLETIFGEFEQVEHGPGSLHAGTGLGLAIVRRLVRAMGGEVRAESRPGQGASFRAVLPLPAAEGSRALTIPHWPGRRMLVVSPAPFAAGFLAETIRATRASVSIVSDQQAAVGALAAGTLDAVLIDHALGDAPAKELALAIKAAGIRDCLILLAPLARRQFGSPQAAGFSGFLIKPVRARSLYERLGSQAPGGFAPAGLPGLAAPAAPVRLNVLVAEDNEINALLLTRTLERLGSTAIWVKDGAAALQRIAAGFAGEETPLDLALLDIRMPGLTGLDCARAVRRLEHGQRRQTRLPIVAVTANVSAADRDAALGAGMDDCLAKPLDRLALERLLERLHRKERESLSA